jgi:hypothetical protein
LDPRSPRANAWRSVNRGLDIPGESTAIAKLAVLAAATIEDGHSGWTNVLVLAGYAVVAPV